MLTFLLKRMFAAMGRRYDYDVSYMHEFAAADPAAIRRFALAMPFFTQSPKVPKNAFWAAKLRATMHADCGTCLRLVVSMAEDSGIEAQLVRDILTGNATDKHAALGAAYADAVLSSAPELPELIHRIGQAWGQKGLANMSAAVCSGQFFPTFKRGFGHGNACAPVLRQLEERLVA